MTKAENYYHSLLQFGIKPGLERIAMLLDSLGNPQKDLKYIHVAGTNGKGTTCSFIAEILKTAGYKTGLYTSPYIVDFRERIRIDGKMISENELDEVTIIVKNAIEQLNKQGIVITEFEAVTAAAFLYYKMNECDYVVLETGLGGRFDATNVIENNIVSVITSISLDHMKILGDTIGKIAFEKCGIIKNGCPVITCTAQKSEAMLVIAEQAEKKNSRLIISDIAKCQFANESISGTEIIYNEKKYSIPFAGRHQVENCINAINAIEEVRKSGAVISDDDIQKGISVTENPARCEVLSSHPLVILDGCHNEDSALALKKVIEKTVSDKKISAVMGMMADKAINKVVDILCPLFDWVITVTPSNPRAESAEALKNIVCKKCSNVTSLILPSDGINKALSEISDNEVLIVCGSLYLCADVRKQLTDYFCDSDKSSES